MPDAIITSTASTFGTITGTFAADQSTITGTVSGVVVGTLTGSVGVPGPQGPAGPGSTWGGIVGDIEDQTDLWTELGTKYPASNPSGFITASALSPYLTTATANATFQTLAGMSSYLTTSAAAAGYYPLTGNPSGFLTAASLSGYATESWVTGQGYITSAALTPYLLSSTAASTYYLQTNPAGYQTASQVSTALSPYLLSATASATYQTLSGMSDYLSKAGNLAGLASTSTARTNLGLGSLAVINDAPSDGSQYARKNGAWDVVTATSSYITSVSSPLSVTSGNLTIDLSPYAPLASPAFTGNPTAPTAALGDNDTSIATTAFVQQELLSGTANARNLEVYVRNQTGSTIPAGSIVYINGATGNRPTITLAQANNDANSAQTFGFTKASIANNGFGFVIVRGELENIDTSALTEGVQLYLSPTTPGTWTTTKPSAPQHLVYVGICVRAHPTQGVILVTVQNGYELPELHDVKITSPTNGQVLKYDSAQSLWVNGTDSAGVAWGGITGTLSSQTDLQSALDAKLFASTASFTYAALTGATFTGSVNLSSLGVTFFDATTQTTAGLSPATAASTYQTISGMSSYAPLASPSLTGNVTITTNSTSPALFIEQSGTGNILTLHDQASDTTFVAIDQNGKIGTIASTTTNAGFNIAHGAAPTTPVNGDIWTTTSGVFARINGATRQYVDFDGTQTINGSKTFSNANNTFGNSTAAGTTNIASGATISGATKAVNLGTSGVAGSTTNITIGSTTGTSTTTLQGTTNGVTQSAGDSSLKLATTAFVTTADNLKANLASPTFTGVPAAPTATLGTNTTQIATTAFVQSAVSAGAGAVWGSITGTLSSQTDLQSALNAKLDSTTAATTYYPLTGNPSGFLTSAPVTSVAGRTGAITLSNTDISGLGTMATATAADYSTTTVANGLYYPLTGNPSGFLTSAPVTSVAGRTGAVTLSNTDISGLGTMATAAAADYALLAGATFTGKVNTPASTTTTAGLNVPHGAAPTTPVNGDIWTTTGNIQWRRNGGTQSLPNIGTSNTFSAGAKQTVSHSATTAGLNVGPVAGDPSSLANGDVWLNSTTNDLKARINGVTETIAEQSWVTASYAPLASPALTGTPTAPTATAGTNTTQIATTAFVTAAIPTNNVKAWVNFNGTGTVAIRASLNVSSITDNGAGNYTLNFTTALADANYAVAGFAAESTFTVGMLVSNFGTLTQTTSAFRFNTTYAGSSLDCTQVHVTVIR